MELYNNLDEQQITKETEETSSQLSEPEDFLSFSPSLFDILCYVDRKDILICKLVCRRLNEVIRTNDKYLPRLEKMMHLIFSTSEHEGRIVAVCFGVQNTLGRQWELYRLTEKGSIGINYAGLLVRLLARREAQKTKRNPRKYGEKRNVFKKLRIILELLFRRYYFSLISINCGDTEDHAAYCSVIGDVFRSCRTKSRKVILSSVASRDVETIYAKLDCQELVLYKLKDVHTQFLSFSTSYSCKVSVGMTTAINLSLVCDIVKSWESGDSRCTNLRLERKSENPPRAEEVFYNIMSKSWFGVISSTVVGSRCEMTFKRSSDHSTLDLIFDATSIEQHYFHFSIKNK